MFLIIFIWTHSHFWALSLYKTEDYRKAKIPMMPITSGIKNTKANILIYSALLFVVSLAPFFLNFSGLIYLIVSFILGLYYLFIAYELFKAKKVSSERKLANKLFGFSIFYLFIIFVTVLIDNVLTY